MRDDLVHLGRGDPSHRVLAAQVDARKPLRILAGDVRDDPSHRGLERSGGSTRPPPAALPD
jgi:hypothetical protein